MTFKKIVGFGDSWTYGDELLDPELQAKVPDAHPSWTQNQAYREQHCFLGLLGQHYNVPVENFGIPGGSLQSAMWTYLWWLEHEPNPEQCLVLHFITEADRTTFYNPDHVHYSNDPPWNKFVHSTWVEFGSSVISNDWCNMVKQNLVLTNCAELRKLTYIQTVEFFDSQSYKLKIPVIQTHVLPPPVEWKCNTVVSPVWPTTDWATYMNRRRHMLKPDGHPNELGHEHIRDLLIPEIERAIIAQ